MKYIIIAIGDELLAGQVVDTNSGAIARMLEPEGWELQRVEVIADTAEALESALSRALSEVQVVLTTGGLGPTRDDRTKQTLCRLFGTSLREDREVLANVRRVIEARSLKLNALTAAQAMVPQSARIIQNEVGTAPILWFERPEDRVVVCMPGVPFETLQMMQRRVKGALLERFPRKEWLERRTVIACGISESALAETLARWEDSLPEFAHLAYLPKPGVVRLRLDGRADRDISAEMDRLGGELAALIPQGCLMAEGDVSPQERALELLAQKGLTLASAESCTGGAIAARLTEVAGASRAFRGSVVAYSNEVKQRLLGVSATDLETHGAVSQPVVEQMALGALEALGADFALATSGIAGPGGGTPEKPVGTVWFALASRSGGVRSTLFRFPGTRDRVIDRTVTAALIALIGELSALPER